METPTTNTFIRAPDPSAGRSTLAPMWKCTVVKEESFIMFGVDSIGGRSDNGFSRIGEVYE